MKKLSRSMPLPCLVCGVDSGPIRIFLFAFIGALVLGSVCLLLWSLGRRHGNEEKDARLALEAERIEEEHV